MALTNINTPSYWDAVYRSEWEHGRIENGARDYGPIHDAIVGLVPEDARVLDIACGHGLLTRKIAQRRRGATVVGVDFSSYAIERNRQRDANLAIEYVCRDVREGLRSVGREFDVVAICELLEHLDDPQVAVGEAIGLLRLGGRIVLTCPHDDEIPDPEHVWRLGHDEVFHLLAPHADSVTFQHFPPPYYHPWMLAHAVRAR